MPTWEEAAELVPIASKGCKGDQSDEVIKAVMGILKRVIQGWEHVAMDDFEFCSISGGTRPSNVARSLLVVPHLLVL